MVQIAVTPLRDGDASETCPRESHKLPGAKLWRLSLDPNQMNEKDRCPQCGTVHPEIAKLREKLERVKDFFRFHSNSDGGFVSEMGLTAKEYKES